MKILAILLLLIFGSCDNDDEPDNPVSGNWNLPSEIEENSGMAYSVETKRLYTLQDSGHSSDIYVTKVDGTFIKKIHLDVDNDDWEDISMGPCGDWFSHKTCIYVADIGDNTVEKSSVYIHITPETSNGQLLKTLKIKYPSGATNAESFSVNPMTGEMYIVSKNYDLDKHTLYKISGNKALKVKKINIKHPIGAMDVSFDGRRAILTTTDTGKFYLMDMADFSVALLKVDKQCCEESVAWIGLNEFIHSSEGSTELVRTFVP